MAHTINATAIGPNFAVQLEDLALASNGRVLRPGKATILDATRTPIGTARFGSSRANDRAFWTHEVRIADQRARIAFYAEADAIDRDLKQALNDTHLLAIVSPDALRGNLRRF